MDGKERSLNRSVRPPPPNVRPHARKVPANHPGFNACSDNEPEGNPYEYIDDHDKQLTMRANAKHAGRAVQCTHDSLEGEINSQGGGGVHPSGAARSDPLSSSNSSSDAQSDATFTGSELALARDTTLLVRHGGFVDNPVDNFTPDVPPRNISMGRANSQVHGGRGHHAAPDHEADFEPSCLDRTPSSSMFIPSDLPKNPSSPQHNAGSPSNSPKKGDSLKTNPDRCQSSFATNAALVSATGPVRNNLRRPTSNHFSHSRFRLRKNFSSCSWKCTAILFIFLCIVLCVALAYFGAMSVISWQQESGKPCTVVVEDAEPVLVSVTDLNSTYRGSHSAGKDVLFARMVRSLHTGIAEVLRVDDAVEGSGGLEVGEEMNDFPSPSIENSISPVLHLRGLNRSTDMVAAKAAAANVIGSTVDDPDQFPESKDFSSRAHLAEEGFIVVDSPAIGNKAFSPLETARWPATLLEKMPTENDVSEPPITVTLTPQTSESPTSAVRQQDCLCSCPCTGPVRDAVDSSLDSGSKQIRRLSDEESAVQDKDASMLAVFDDTTNSQEINSTTHSNESFHLNNLPHNITNTTDDRQVDDDDGLVSSANVTVGPPPAPPPPPTRAFDNIVLTNPLSRWAAPDGASVSSSILVAGPTAFPAKTLPPDGSTFMDIVLGRRVTNDIPPYGHWNAQFHQPRTAFVRFNYTIPKDASLGIYGRRNAIPTHTQYDFVEILSDEEKRRKRNLKETMNIVFVQYLDAGQWFLSMYNDDNKLRDVSFITAIADDLIVGCPYDCHDHGTCVRGVCECYPGYTGHDCSRSVCPVLCSGNGEYLNGHCVCKPGWKGNECNLRYDECEVPGCHGHGHCIDGKCRCAKGYKGEFCELVDCLVPDCTGHGVCVEGSCICHRGWKGDACDEVDGEVRKCLPDCSGHGKFDLEKVKCVCDAKWAGPDCSKELCDMDCGTRGRCESGRCHCDEGWTGSKCDIKMCDPRCLEHGQCKNGSCICIQGWNGRHCTLDGCPRNCHNHGECVHSREGDWMCQCMVDWEGPDCSIALERICDDEKDNDNDGLVDCEDSECCQSKSCSDSVMCSSTADPLEILLKKQPPAVTASFFQRMRFLIEEDSVQNYARKNAFNESRASVIRGRVVSPSGGGIVGVRVSTNNSQEGFTVTRQTGWFDLMVNGGGAVTLQFVRAPFKLLQKAVIIPWNEVIIIDNVVISTQDGADQGVSVDPCADHDYDGVKPVVLATWKHEFLGGCPERSTILAESQVIQESLTIPGTSLHLMYHSSRAGGYMSTIQLQLTPTRIPKALRLIHLRISIEGILFEKVFEADPVLKYTYAWNRRNVYRQRVYGVTTATVSVGYAYSACKTVIWDVQTTKLSGHDMSISDIGGWNLDIHHRYNFHEGILQKGDGTNIYLRYKPRVLLTTMGNGQQRHLDCFNCNGVASEQRLVAPVALASSPDGSLYVGDFNLVRRILPDQTVQTVLKLNLSQVAYRYHLTVNPVDGSVYLSDPERHQILRLKAVDDIADVESNYDVVIGSGARCLPGDKGSCGDGGPAKDSKLMYPKGIVFSADGIIYFADGTNIRIVDKKGYIHTLIGDHHHKGHWKPIPCHGTLNLDEVHLRWPTELAVNPLDRSLHIIDDHMILKLTQDGRIKVVAGQPLHCPSPGAGRDNLELASHTTLISPESIAFAPSGELYIAESDSQRINRVRVIGTDGRIADFAGVESKCNCLENNCKCFDEDHFLASLSKLSTISSVCVTPDGIVHIADQGNLRVRSVMATLPEPTRFREYEIYAPETQEVYVFNRYGQHVLTKNILTGRTVYTFMYNLNTSFGKLNSITDAAGNKIFILRDYSTMVNTIENTQGQKVRLVNTRMRMLQNFVLPGSYNVTFDYHGSTGLLKSKRDSLGQSFLYVYDDNGRLVEAVTPSGEIVQMKFDLSVKGAEVTVTRDRGFVTAMQIKGLTVTNRQGMAESKIVVHNEGGVTLHFPWGRSVITEASTYPILSDVNPVLGESFPIPSRQKIYIHDDLVHRMEWRYYLRKDGKGRDKHISQVIRKMKINGDNLLAVEYDRDVATETVFDQNQVALLTVSYDGVGRPQRWVPAYNLSVVELKYDRFGRLAQWQRGDVSEHYEFDREGRLAGIRFADKAVLSYKFGDTLSGLPVEIILPSGRRYELQYDEMGSLQAIVTPKEHKHEFSIQTSLGFYKLQYTAPSMRQPFVVQYNDRGEIMATMYPGVKGRASYAHSSDGKLEAMMFGDSKIEYVYYGDTSLLKYVSIDASGFDCRTDYKYHGALIKEEKIRFGVKLGLSGVRIKYQYDGNARFQRSELEINGKEVHPLNFNYNIKTGMLESVMQFSLKRVRFDEIVFESKEEQFSKVRLLDHYGRIVAVSVSLAGKEVYHSVLTYDVRDRLQRTQTKVGVLGAFVHCNYSYTVDGLLEEVGDEDPSKSWKFRHDENGNIVAIVHGKKEVKLRYNEGDRLIAFGDFDMNIIDGRGFMVQKGEEKFLYNAHAQLTSAAHRNLYEVHYHYDAVGRLIARKDTQGNITQYFYTDVRRPTCVTFVHHPKTSQTVQLMYDDVGHLTYVEFRNTNTKYFVMTDSVGSPIAFFDLHGDFVKEVRRSPFGAVLVDSNPHLYIPVDFHGGLHDPITGLIHYGSRVYDPVQTQWMTPDWENILDYIVAPQNMYLYRFKNNDPLNPLSDKQQYFTELVDWLPMFGYSMEDISGGRGELQTFVGMANAAAMASNLPVISGLGCAADVINREFYHLSFVPVTRVKAETHFSLRRPPITHKRAVFGDGILVSRQNGRAVVNVLEGASQIVQDVIVSVLNNSHFLDIHFASHGQDVFHFVKDGPANKVQDDHNQLQRLSGVFNVSMHDSEHGTDLKLHGHSATINIRYGTTVDQERHRLLKHARKRDIDQLWNRPDRALAVANLSMGELKRQSGRRRRKGRQSTK